MSRKRLIISKALLKRLMYIVLILLLLPSNLAGCWDRKELTELGIVLAVGLDRDKETGKILLTSQVVRPAGLQKQGGGGNEAPYDVVVTSGSTYFEAVRNTVKEFDRRSFFSHIKVIVVGEALAREGLNDLIDFIARTHEIRKATWLIVANGSEARKVLGVKHGIENVQANYMEGIIKSQDINAEVTSSGIIDFIKTMPGEGINPVTGVFRLIKAQSIPKEGVAPVVRQGLDLAGTAVFQKDKLVGFLTEEQTRGFNFITGKQKSATVNVASPSAKQQQIAIEINKITSKVTPVITDGIITFHLKIMAVGNITEVQTLLDVSDPKQLELVNVELAKMLEREIRITINTLQHELKTDVLGFGSAFQRKYPQQWERLKPQWDKQFSKAAYTLEVETNLIRTGLLLKPINNQQTAQ